MPTVLRVRYASLHRLLDAAVIFVGLSHSAIGPTFAQVQDLLPDTAQQTLEVPDEQVTAAPNRVDVEPVAPDTDIQRRVESILEATGWFPVATIRVDEGIVFLDGRAEEAKYRDWAEDLARNTEGVVAVVNRIQVADPPIWDFSPAHNELEAIAKSVVRGFPLFFLALIILVLAWIGGRIISQVLRRALLNRIPTRLLRDVTARVFGALFFLLGVYLVLRVSGLTRLAITVIGGTGLIGLILGIAFRDITENFLSSLLLSIQQPFREADLVDIAGTLGYVQRLTSRTTVLTTFEGDQVQIPNSTVFKGVIRNYTSNPNHREDFTIGIGYNDSIPQAQDLALRILSEHEAVLDNPEPWVLVDNLGPATVNLRVYFWINTSRHSWLKVRSSVIRLIKRAFQDHGISLPDEAREVIFPQGVPVQILQSVDSEIVQQAPAAARQLPAEEDTVSTRAEAGLHSESSALQQQAAKAWLPDGGENLLSSEKPSSGGAQV